MNTITRLLLRAIVLVGCTQTREPPSVNTSWSARDSARVDAVLAPLIAQHAFMGAVAFVRDGKIVYSKGTGKADVARGVDFTPATPADGGSLAKTLTAAAVWSLVHEGRIEIDTLATAYLPEYPYEGTTVRQLITHTNGLPPAYEQFDPYFGPTQLRTTTALLSTVKREMPQPRFTPGTGFEYSNLGFDAAALVVERVTGQPISRVFRERFFEPLGMHESFVRPPRLAEFPQPRTLGHRWADTGWVVVDVFDNEAFVGASNVYFSTLDLARWSGAHATGTALPAAVRVRGEPRPLIRGRPSAINGLSWYCDDAGARCQYTGAINAFHSLAYWDRTSRNAVAMISNSDLAPWTLITLQRDLVAILEGRQPDHTPRPSFLTVDDERRSDVAGRYVLADGDTIRVFDSRDGLRVQVGAGLDVDAFHITPEIFYVPTLDFFVGFSRDANGLRMHVRSMFLDAVASRAR